MRRLSPSLAFMRASSSSISASSSSRNRLKRLSESGRIFEAAEGDDDGVVVAGGNARHGPLAVARGELVFAGDEEIGVRIELEEFGGPLVYQVIGDDEHGFLSEAEPFEFHRGRH